MPEIDGAAGDWDDEVVVERDWAEELHRTSNTGSGSCYSDHGLTPPEKSGDGRGSGEHTVGGTNTDVESFALRTDGIWGKCRPLAWVRWRAWPFVFAFFFTRFLDDKAERQYQVENWWVRKVRLQCTRLISIFSP